MRKYPVWYLPEPDSLVRDLQTNTGISRILAQLLYHRGIRTVSEARSFLWGGLDELASPGLIPGIEPAVVRLEQARQNRESVLIYGDYDVDGICSIAILKECLDYLGVNCDYYIPSRFSEGYGLNREAVMLAAEQGYRLLVTVDCGVTSREEVTLANKLGLEVIITDHHQPPELLPPAVAVVNPRLGLEAPFRELAGAGVAFKLVTALCSRLASDYQPESLLDLVALATVADIVPLRGENRILVKAGLKLLEQTRRPGLQALLRESGLTGKRLTAWHVAFLLAPRLNAAGRMGEAAAGVRLVMADNLEEARELAQFLNQQNRRRQEVEAEIFDQARQEIAATVDLEREKVILVGGEGWHPGVLGIVAAKVVEAFQRPAILVSWENEQGKGSGRSVAGFDLYHSLSQCGHLLLKYGGHRQAAGITLERPRFEEFKRELNQKAEQVLTRELLLPRVQVDAEVAAEEIDIALLKELEWLEPYGEGNASPSLVLRRVQVLNPGLVGKNSQHLRFQAEGGGKRFPAIAFGMAEFSKMDYSTGVFDLLFQPELDTYNGDSKLVLKIRDLKASRLPDVDNKANRYPQVFLSLEEELRNELHRSAPVLLVYPTLRCLDRHYLAIASSFSPQVLTILSGGRSPQQQARAVQELTAGSSRLFLTTRPFLQYYIENFPLPGNLSTIHFLWPDESDMGRLDAAIGAHTRVVQHSPGGWLPAKSEFEGWEGIGKLLIYTNRAGTVRQLCQRWKQPALEAGVSQLERRQRARHKFLQGESEVLISDARFGGSFPALSQLGGVVFADAPFGLWEARAFLSQVQEGEKVGIWLAFTGTALDLNQQYLEKAFPEVDTVRAFWQCFRAAGPTWVTLDKALRQQFNQSLGRKVDDIEIKAVLRILVELQLCHIRRQGTTMQVMFPDHATRRSIYNSPYYLEGVAEKESFGRWREMCKLDKW